MRRLRAILARHAERPLARSVALIVFVVLLANALPLTGVVDTTPLDNRIALPAQPAHTFLPGEHTVDPNDGFTADALGHAAAESWLHGHVPYWNSNEGLGTPLAGEMQAGAFSPFVLLLHFRDGLLYLHVLLEIIAGIATLCFLAGLGLRRGAATLGGVLFALNGTHAWLTNAVFAPIAFLPVMLVGVERCLRRSEADEPGGFGWIVAGVSLSLLAGFPEVAYLDALLVLVWALCRLRQIDRTRRVALLRKLAAGVGFGVMIAAPALVAFADYLANADIGAHGTALSTLHLDSGFVFALVLPYAAGMIFGTGTPSSDAYWGSVGGYLGISVVVFALFGLFQRRRRWTKIVLAAFALVVVVRIFGLVPGVTTMLNLIPGVRYTAFLRYSSPALEFAVVILAAFGVDHLLRGERSRRQLVVISGCVAAVLVAAAIQARLRVAESPPVNFRVALAVGSVVVAALVGFGILACAAASRRIAWAPRLACALAVVEAVVLFALPQLSANENAALVDEAPIAFLQQHLGTARFFSIGPIAPNYGSYFDIAELNVNDVPTPEAWAPFVVTSLNANAYPQVFTGTTPLDPNGPDALHQFEDHLAGYRAAGVRYLLVYHDALTSADAARLSLTKVFTSAITEIYELPDPAAYFQAPGCAVHAIDRAHVAAVCDGATTLTRLEMNMPGWTASVNGHAVTPATFAGVYQRIALPAGASAVTFTFEPPHIRWAWAAPLLAMLGLGAVAWRRRPARATVAHPSGRVQV